MAFNLDGIIIDRIQLGIAESPTTGDLLYTLTQLSDATIETSAESKDAVDAQGTLVKRFWQAKTASLSATSAMMDFNILGEQSGSGKQVASAEKKIQMPKVMLVDKTTDAIALDGVVTGTIHVNAIGANGTMGKAYTQNTAASASQFGFDASAKELHLPTDAEVSRFVVKYERMVESGAMVDSRADEFPGTIKLTLKCLAVDQCSTDVLRACYVVFPSFQISPETSTQLTTDATFDFSGDAQVDYCSANKQLYYICMAEDDEEE